MTPEGILSHSRRVLTQAQREHYFEHGYVCVENLVAADRVADLVRVTEEFVDASRAETESGRVFDLGPGHSDRSPVLRRLKRPDDQHEALYDLYGADGTWMGCLDDRDASAVDMSKTVYLTGRTGSITIHNCRTLHYSPSSRSPEPRPLLLNCYSSADAKAYTPHPDPSSHTYEVVRGEPVQWAEHDPRPCQIPPDWSGGYTSIFAAQAGES